MTWAYWCPRCGWVDVDASVILVYHCQWPGCPSAFYGAPAPVVLRERDLALAMALDLATVIEDGYWDMMPTAASSQVVGWRRGTKEIGVHTYTWDWLRAEVLKELRRG